MEQFIIPTDVFWIHKGEVIIVVKSSESDIYNLEGIAADVFRAIANKSASDHISGSELTSRVLQDLQSLSLISKI